jgi:Pentapeptide repeats (8 copies)
MCLLSFSHSVNSIKNYNDNKNPSFKNEDTSTILTTKISKYLTQEEKTSLCELKRDYLEKICKDNYIDTPLKLSSTCLRGVDLSNFNLSGADFSNADLRDTNMTNTNLTRANLSGAKLENIHWDQTDITNVEIDLDDIHFLPLSDKEEYTKIIECIKRLKSPEIMQKEISAINEFKKSLDVKNKVQERLSKLSDEQLQILFPCLYVEAAHKQNPIIAYNTKDPGYQSTQEDDNVLMIKGYTHFLSTLNNTFAPDNNKNDQEKLENVTKEIKDIIRLLTGVGIHAIYNDNLRSSFSVHKSYIYESEKLHKEIEKGKLTLSELACDITLDSDQDEISFHGTDKNSIVYMNKTLRQFSNDLISAHAKNDIVKIFKLTSDFQYAHLLPNANGRVSQIIRDCLSIHLGQLPFSALNFMSHYFYLKEPVDKEHLNFMQNNFDEIFTAIEKRELTVNTYRKAYPEDQKKLLEISKDNPAIKLDVDILAKCIENNKKIKNKLFERE